MFVCMHYVRTHVCIYICMYLRMHVCMFEPASFAESLLLAAGVGLLSLPTLSRKIVWKIFSALFVKNPISAFGCSPYIVGDSGGRDFAIRLPYIPGRSKESEIYL